MVRKRKAPESTVPVSTPASVMIDLLIPLLATHGVSVTGRPKPDTLAGVVDGLSDTTMFFGEIFANEEGIYLKVWTMSRFYPDKELDIAAKIDGLNNRPECSVNGDRWLRIAPTKERFEGSGKNVMLVARIKVVGGNVLSDDCDEKIRYVMAVIRDSWPMP